MSWENTDASNTYVLSKGTAVCVLSVGGLQPTFTMCMGGVSELEIGENTTTTWYACVEPATRLGMRNDEKEEDTVTV